jgi:hypothetical protein
MAVDHLLWRNGLMFDEVVAGVDGGIRSHIASLPRITDLVRLS